MEEVVGKFTLIGVRAGHVLCSPVDAHRYDIRIQRSGRCHVGVELIVVHIDKRGHIVVVIYIHRV